MNSGLSYTGRLLLTSFGLGRLRPAPGTWGSLPPVALAAVLILLGAGPCEACGTFGSMWIVYHLLLLGVCAVFCAACVRYGDAAEAHFNSKDPSSVTADETAGMCLALLFLPHASMQNPLITACVLATAFVAFRIMDIIKPWPAHGLQRVPGGWGILLDDLFAGLYALAAVQLLWRVLL